MNVRFTDDEFSDKQRTYYRRCGHEAVSWQKSDTGFCGCSSFDFFDDRAGTYENRVDSEAEGICPDSHMSYEDVSCKSTGVCRNRRSTYKADQSPYFSGAEQRVSGWQYASAYAVFPVSDLVRLLLLF